MANNKLDKEPGLEYEELIQFLVLRERGDVPDQKTDWLKLMWLRNSKEGDYQSKESTEKKAGEGGVLAGEEEEEEEEGEFRQTFAIIVVNLDIGGDFARKINVFAVEGEDICRMSVRETMLFRMWRECLWKRHLER